MLPLGVALALTTAALLAGAPRARVPHPAPCLLLNTEGEAINFRDADGPAGAFYGAGAGGLAGEGDGRMAAAAAAAAAAPARSAADGYADFFAPLRDAPSQLRASDLEVVLQPDHTERLRFTHTYTHTHTHTRLYCSPTTWSGSASPTSRCRRAARSSANLPRAFHEPSTRSAGVRRALPLGGSVRRRPPRTAHGGVG